MKAPKFDRIVEKRFDSCKSILLSKADEYASGTDRLHNFIRAGAARGRDPVVALNYLLLLEGLIEDRRSKVDPEDIE